MTNGRSQQHLREAGGGANGLQIPIFNGVAVADPTSPDAVSYDGSVHFNLGNTPPVGREDAFPYPASGLPTGPTIAATTGIVSGTGTLGSYGNAKIIASNVFGSANTGLFTWSVGPQEPVAAGSISVTGIVPVIDLDADLLPASNASTVTGQIPVVTNI